MICQWSLKFKPAWYRPWLSWSTCLTERFKLPLDWTLTKQTRPFLLWLGREATCSNPSERSCKPAQHTAQVAVWCLRRLYIERSEHVGSRKNTEMWDLKGQKSLRFWFSGDFQVIFRWNMVEHKLFTGGLHLPPMRHPPALPQQRAACAGNPMTADEDCHKRLQLL